MKAYRIIEGSAFGPEVLKISRTAFDEAWTILSPNFSASEYEAARESLAQAIMFSTREDSLSVERLRDVGIRAIQAAYPNHFHGEPQPARDKDLA